MVFSHICEHTNIVSHRDTFTDGSDILCVLEYLPSTLQHYMNTIARQKFRLREDEALGFLHDILEGIYHLHKNGISHGDLKPSNILLAPNRHRGCVAKISDFGTACFFGSPSDGCKPARDETCRSNRGTRRYQPPEVLMEKQDPSDIHEIDIWSAGCIFVEILSGGTSFVDTRTCVSALHSIHKFVANTRPLWSQAQGIPHDHRRNTSQHTPNKPWRDQEETFAFLKALKPTTIDLIQKLLAIDPMKRASADSALHHPAFAETYVIRCLPMPLPPSKVREVSLWIHKNTPLIITPNSNCFSRTPPPSRSLVDKTPPRKLFD